MTHLKCVILLAFSAWVAGQTRARGGGVGQIMLDIQSASFTSAEHGVATVSK